MQAVRKVVVEALATALAMPITVPFQWTHQTTEPEIRVSCADGNLLAILASELHIRLRSCELFLELAARVIYSTELSNEMRYVIGFWR